MGLGSLLLLTLATSVDGLWGGFAMGLRPNRFGLSGLVIIAGSTVLCSAAAMLAGRSLLAVLDVRIAQTLGGAIMIAVGGWVLRDGLLQRELLKEHRTDPVTAETCGGSDRSLGRRIVARLLDPFSGNHAPQVSNREALALGTAVAADTSVLSMAAGIAGFNPYLTPLIFGLAHLIMVSMGNSLARHRVVLRTVGPLTALPGLILIAVGLIRLLAAG